MACIKFSLPCLLARLRQRLDMLHGKPKASGIFHFPTMTQGYSFLLDENVDVRVGKFLEQEDHNVSFVPKGIRNGQVLALSQKIKSILIKETKPLVICEPTQDGFQIHELNPNDTGLGKK